MKDSAQHGKTLAVTYRAIAELKPAARNARTHSPQQIAQLAASIREFGWTNPILIDEHSQIIAGHGRVEAARSLGMADVATIALTGLSAAQKRALVLADNKLALNAGWDDALLRIELAELKAEAFDISMIGFSNDEIADIFADRTAGLTDPDDAPAVEAVVVSKSGDLWLLGGHRLLCGDCTKAEDVARAMGDAKPHLMVTDPPYGVSYDATWRGKAGHATLGKNRTGKVTSDDRADWREVWALYPGNIAYVWHGGLHSAVVAESLAACGLYIRSQIIWVKTVMAMGRGDYHWRHEPCWYAVRGTGNWAGDRKQTTVWEVASPLHIMSGSREEKTEHPTQKPVECMKRPIENNSRAGDAVYDPFVGSGTTIIAAEMTGRRCIALEVAPQYVDVAVRRWQQFTGQRATLEATGEPFDEAREDAIDVEIAKKRLAEIDAA